MFNNQNILITGGTGSFGNAFVNYIMRKYNPKKIIIFSRDELKQKSMREKIIKNIKDDKLYRFFIGDIRDKDRLDMALNGVDYVVHAAALKQVDTAEYNPFEFIKTNILGAQNLIECSLKNNIKRVIALSTDKAAQAINLYGATKLVSDKLFVSANNFRGKNQTIFSVVRYGNVSESRGSVIPHFKNLIKRNKNITLTDERMTRFWITLDESVKFVNKCLKIMKGGEIFIPKLPSIKIIDLIKAMNSKAKIDIIGIRPGEKLYEIMSPNDEVNNTYEFKNYYLIYPAIRYYNLKNNYSKSAEGEIGKKVRKDFEYSSKNNNKFLSIQEIKKELSKLNKNN